MRDAAMFIAPREQKLGAAGILFAGSSCVLLFLFMAYPMVLQLLYVKAFLFAIVIVAVALEYLTKGHSRLNFTVSLWTIGLALLSFFFVIEGFFRATPGATKMALVYVVWPLAYMIWIAGVSRRKLIIGIDHIALVSTLFIVLYGCAFLLTQLNILPATRVVSALSMGWEFESFGAEHGFTGMAFPGLNSLPFLLPYLMARIATQVPEQRRTTPRQIALWGTVILGWIVTLAASRRALFLVVMLTPLCVLMHRFFQPVEERRLNRRSFVFFSMTFFAGMIVLFFALGVVYQFDLSSFWERFSSAFDLSTLSVDESGGGATRREQLFALIHGWLENPILGAGHGATAVAYGSIRSDTMPWAYELSYLALLFQIGLVGFMAYAAGVIWIFRRGIAVIGEGGPLGRIMLPMLVGFSGLLIANATNPYLLRLDGMWMFFLPLAVINYRLVVPVQQTLLHHRNQPSLSFNC